LADAGTSTFSATVGTGRFQPVATRTGERIPR
jgi:hypothetical protein